ncbi:MAG: bifunctional ADP-dependent NAD(P)H-hydrate dehydratase/NAD(P)H-hydrate epimerase, partial [Treponema sp.]|nr:bifunctional ADP-dependent NAD(P)H-hydrate dehydratase/NAD(P)H-hydrate epimerase [Treponema sp.]
MMDRKPLADTAFSGLCSASGAKALDEEASAWGLNPFSLVEAAGRACAKVFSGTYLQDKRKRSIAVFAGKGNNAADALVMLKALILEGYAQAPACSVLIPHIPDLSSSETKTPFSEAMLAVRKLGVPVLTWEAGIDPSVFAKTDVIIDGINGTGLIGPLRSIAMEMAGMINSLRSGGPFVVSVDVPSGNFDGWQSGMPIIAADATLALEPQKICLYFPAARPFAGAILPVGGIFPPALIDKHREAELAGWEAASAKIPPIPKTAYKYERGLVEIMAGSSGSAGAARLAALGAQSAGAGLVRLIVDPSLYPVAASGCSGIMVVPDGSAPGETAENSRFSPNAALLGPGWGRGEDRMRLLESYLPREKQGIPLILDADAILLAKDIVFNGNVLITPHPGEFAAYTGISKKEILACPIPVLRHFAAIKKVYILLKSHVLYAACPNGRIGVIDGMNPLIAAGGSGDVLAGFCAAIAARQ